MATTNRLTALLLSLFLILQLLSLTVSAADCSKTKLCATGCCSKDGFCGTTSAHCGTGCLSTCDWKPAPTECSAKKLCATGCCSKDGFCGTTSAHCGSGCQSTCDFKLGCDKSNPCKDGSCCSKFGFCGFGPDFCSKDTCVAGCDAKTYCDPGGYGSEYAEHTKCPLNVCCSKWGYCGLTEEFCGKKKVKRPSCSAKGLPMKRVVGYYEGWAPGRVCDKFKPSDIPDGVYTHLNFAFASIDPKTFQVVPAAKGDTELYRQLTQKKRADANLKVFLAIGGWAFNDPGPTVTTFSDIARSEANQRAFITSLVSLLNTYNFDGVDIDWEYPEAPDRQGRGEDFANLPKFLRNIKSSLTQNGDKNGLSIAVPASYWYLQHFDIVNIAKHVDFFNVMTYDLHGSWDTPESWLGSHLNSHTNLTEIEDALDLLWRNQIDPDQVNLGLAFYSRTFTASNAGCMSPGCLFTSGAPKGPCSDAVGVLSNAEIDRKVSSTGASVTLDKKAAAKILKSGRDWMTYDDADTWKIKLDFARSQCLGGAMVWAISQDTLDGKYSRQLQSVTGYKSRALSSITTNVNVGIPGTVLKEMEISESSTDVTKKQCRWSNCGQGCPSGWKPVPRRDPYRDHFRELMYDDTGCDGKATRVFCCPPGDQPWCQWLFFNGGKCNPGCPASSGIEVASTKAGCNNGKAQVACCKDGGSSMDIYRQCQWYGKEHDCAVDIGTKSCGWSSTYNMPLFSSGDGSGAQVCRDSSGTRRSRPYCCDESDSSNAHWKNCQWYDNFALGLTPYAGEKTCNANCPAGKIKIALDHYESLCGDGTSAYCCDAEVTISADEKKKNLKETLIAWAKAPTCPNVDRSLSSRSVSEAQGNETQADEDPTVVKRAVPQVSAAAVNSALQDILDHPPNSKLTKETRELWDDAMGTRWGHLSGASLSSLWYPVKDTIGSTELIAASTLCNMNGWNAALESTDSQTSVIQCPMPRLGLLEPSLLENPDDSLVDPPSTTRGTLADQLGWIIWPFTIFGDRGLSSRIGGVRDFKVTCPDQSTFQVFSEQYPNGDKGENLATANGDKDRYYVNNAGGNCFSSGIADDGDKDDKDMNWVSEHILELQMFRDFIEYSTSGKLDPKPGSRYGTLLKAEIFTGDDRHELSSCNMWKVGFVDGFPAWTKAGHTQTPMKTLYNILGSVSNPSEMVNCEAKLNNIKTQTWGLSDPMSVDKWNKRCKPTTKLAAETAITTLQMVFGVWQYHNDNNIQAKLLATHVAVADFLAEFEKLYRKEYPTTPPMGLEDIHWREYMTKHVTRMVNLSNAWAAGRIKSLISDWTAHGQNLLKKMTGGMSQAASKALAEEINIMRQNLVAFKQLQRNLDSTIKFDEMLFLQN
ncbi:hypothetical protein AUP68_16824 [Ilyonectria robusta]